jgi:hypothetical protein
MSDEQKNTEIDKFLISLFVEKKQLFSNLIDEINRNIKEVFNINFQYDYDSFCHEYLKLTKDFFRRHPEVDYTDLNMVNFYTNIIIGELFSKIKMKYGSDDGTKNTE